MDVFHRERTSQGFRYDKHLELVAELQAHARASRSARLIGAFVQNVQRGFARLTNYVGASRVVTIRDQALYSGRIKNKLP